VIEDASAPWREDFLIEHLEGANPIPTYCAVRSDRWKYVRYATGEEELYELEADPFELENLAAVPASASVLEDRRDRLRELCVPAPPGYGDDASTTVPIALLAIGGLIATEVVAMRRRRTGAGVRGR
jgi:arylsulfatase A-like enzyme